MPFARVNGIRVYYELHGRGEETVVFIGGLGSQVASWAQQVPMYSRYFRVLVFDNRGAGRTDKPDEEYSLRGMADDAVRLMDELGIETAHVVGKSMGGMIAQWLAVDHPSRVRKLVLGCTAASRDEVGNEILRFGRQTALRQGMKAVWLGALFWGYSRSYIERNLGRIREAMEAVDESEESVRGYVRQNLACERHDARALVGTIRCPTLVIYGERDLIVSPERSRELASLIPGAAAVEFKGAGHGFWRERQDEVDRLVVDFLLGRR